MWSSDLPLVKQEKPMVYPSPEPSLYSKPSKLWGQPRRTEGHPAAPASPSGRFAPPLPQGLDISLKFCSAIARPGSTCFLRGVARLGLFPIPRVFRWTEEPADHQRSVLMSNSFIIRLWLGRLAHCGKHRPGR